jgi:hypothetical protein
LTTNKYINTADPFEGILYTTMRDCFGSGGDIAVCKNKRCDVFNIMNYRINCTKAPSSDGDVCLRALKVYEKQLEELNALREKFKTEGTS